MHEKRVFPLNNPLSEKTTVINSGNKFIKPDDRVVNGYERGVSKGGKARVTPVEAILHCPHCGRYVKIVFTYGRPPEWVRCIWCGELQPADGYRVTMYGGDLPRVLAPHELRMRQRESEEQY